MKRNSLRSFAHPAGTAALGAVAFLGPIQAVRAGFEQSLHQAVADTHIERGSAATVFGSSQLLWLKRASATSSNGTDRAFYLRFSAPADRASATEALLEISISQYPGDGTSPFVFDVYGLPDSHPDEAFDEGLLSFNSAVNASTTLSGSFNIAGLTPLGSFTPPAASGALNVEFSSAALRDFVANSTNTDVTLAVVRRTVNNLPTYIHSSEASVTGLRPTLVLRRPAASLSPATITASSTLSGFPVSLAADDNPTTRWSATADTSSTRSWITFDFGSPQTVNRLNFITHENGRTYRIESSDNNTTWSAAAADFRGTSGAGVNATGQDVDVFLMPRTARYFRITSLVGISGRSVSFREVQLLNDPAAAPFLTRIAGLSSAVAALPADTAARRIKRTVLELAIERGQSSFNAGEAGHASALLDDVDASLATDPVTMAAQVSGLPQIRTLRPLAVTGITENPYLRRMVDGANLFLAANDPPWDKNTPFVNVLEDFNLARATGAQMDALMWLFAHPDSPLKDDPEILRRLLRRTHAYLDAVRVHGATLPPGQLASFYDDFAFTPASGVFREFSMLYPGLVGTNATADWNQAVQTAAQNMWSAWQNRAPSWVNTDVAIACSLFNLGERTGNAAMLAKAELFINDILTSGRMFEDGAVGYIGTQNEAGGYQSIVAEYVGRYHETTGSPNAALILSKMQWYGPINGRLADWWTSPSWKDLWNDIRTSFPTGESVSGTNPYVRAELDAWINAPASLTNWYGRPRVDLAWYQSGTPALQRPDYTVFDRNTRGPRAWYGRWNYSATLRPIDPSEPGHCTIMGAQVADPDPDFRTNASLMGVYPRIRVVSSPSRNADTSLNESGHAWQTSELLGDSTVTRDFSAIGASYRIHQFASSVKGAAHDWTARQVWLNLPDRVIGLLDIAPNSDQTAFEVQGVLRLGFGGTAFSSAKSLVSTGPDSWSYGDLRIKLHSHDYAEVTPETYLFRVAAAPITEITLRDSPGAAANTTPVTYPAGTRRAFVSEVRPSWALGEVIVTEVAAPGGLIGLDVNHPSTGRRYRVLYNPGSTPVAHIPSLPWSGPVRIHQSGARHRPDWVPDPSGPLVSNYLVPGQSITIPAAGHVVLEQVAPIVKANNADPLDQASSWVNTVPLDGGIARWDATVTGSNNVSTGNGVSLAGLLITNPGGDLSITTAAPGTLALGPAGIDASTSSRTINIAGPLRLDASQSWLTGSSGTEGSPQITANGTISGSAALTLDAASDRGIAFNHANTFSGGFTLIDGTVHYSGAPAVAPSSGTMSYGPFGTGPLALHGGTLVAGNRPFHQPSVAVNGDFTWSTTARNDTSGSFNLGGTTRTVYLTRAASPSNVVVSGGNNAIRFTTITGGIGFNTFANGSLRIAPAPSVGAPNLIVATFGTGGGNRFTDNAGLVAATGTYISPSFTSAPFGPNATERPLVTLEPGSFLSLSDGGSGRGHAIFALEGSGTVLNNTSGTAARTDTLTFDGGLKTSVHTFSGTIRDTDTTTFPTANPNLRTAVVKAGSTTQVLAGSALHTGSTAVNAGGFRVSGTLGGTSGLSVAAGAMLEVSGSLHVAGNIVNHGTIILTGNATFTLTGTLTNQGTLDLSSWSGTLPPGLVNHGNLIAPPGPESFTGWQAIQWPGVSDPAITGPMADPDADDRVNLLEWALHLDPVRSDPPPVGLEKSGTTLVITYTRRITAPGAAAFEVEWADSPAGPWTTDGVVQAPAVGITPTSERVTATLPAGESTGRFVRLRVSTP